MNEKEIAELRRRFKPDKNSITHIYGCYVGETRQIVSQFDQSVALLPQEETDRLLGLLKKSLSGTQGKNLLDIVFSTMQVADSDEHRLLMKLRDTMLEDESVRAELYEKIIGSLQIEGNYLILLAHDSYDVPYRSKDGEEQEDAGSGEVLSLTLNALYALAKLRKPQDLVKAAFELRLACIGGYEPDLTGCAVCGRADCGRFLVSGGCLQCLECGLGEGLSLPVSAGCLAAMRYITGCDAKRLFSFSLDGPARKELADAAETYLVTQLERGFYTLDFYKSLLLT